MAEITSTGAKGLGVSISGTPEAGFEIKLSDVKSLEGIFGTEHPEMANALLGHCIKALAEYEMTDDRPANDERQFMLAAVAEIQPRDAIERMIAVQMAATHVATIRAAHWLSKAQNLPQTQAHSTAYTKLAKAFTAQVEALRKHRNGGKQTVTVQHVNVSDGGQAIVGDVHKRGGSYEK